MSAHTQAKATRLLAEGRVHDTGRTLREYRIRGDAGTYRVFIAHGSGEDYCTCPASGACSHIAAAYEAGR